MAKQKKNEKRLVMGCDSQLFFFPPPPLIWCLLEMNDDSFRRQCRVEDRKKQHTGRGQTPDSREEKRNWYGACFIFIPAPSSLVRLSLLAFD